MVPVTEETDDSDHTASGERPFADARLGQLVAGTYQITRYIGSGGSSHVFEAEHTRLGKSFAIKLLRTELDTSRRAAQRFRREAKAIARLQSEHIVNVVDCGELDDQTPYLVMELLEGEDLRSLLNREGPLPARRAVQIVLEACRGLTTVHQGGLVHRDLKPENLFITRRATDEDWCKVLDFGVAKMDASLSTAQGAIVGTVRYMAPEQLADGAAVGPTTDVYALGAILHECLSGRPLVGGATVQEVMYQLMNVDPQPLRELSPTAPAALEEIVRHCVQKSSSKRPSSADALAKLLRNAMASESPRHDASTDTWPEEAPHADPAPAPQTRSRAGLAAVALGCSLAAGLGGWALRGAPTSTVAAVRPAATAAATLTRLASAATSAVAVSTPVTPQPSQSVGSASPISSTARKTSRALRSEAARPLKSSAVDAPALPPAASRFDNTNPYGE